MPKVLLKFFEEAVERTEEEIAELTRAGLVREQPPPQDPPPSAADAKGAGSKEKS